MRTYGLLGAGWLAIAVACSSCIGGGLAREAPPLIDMEEPVALLTEPDDEALRQALDAGGFSGVYVKDSRVTSDEKLEEPEGVLVEHVVENSPGAIAGLLEGDLIYEVQRPQDASPIAVDWPSDWRKLELEAEAGDEWRLTYDRAGLERDGRLSIVSRVAPAARDKVETFREEDRVGVVMRTATEVESRQAGLAPGAGAVITGLSRSSPWRADGLTFGDLLVEIEGQAVAHPQVVLEAIRSGDEGRELRIIYAREGARDEVVTRTTVRESETSGVHIPPLFQYTADADGSDTTLVYGLLGYESTKAAWEFTLLWFITFSGGDSDTLEEVDR